ncbi:hypothetical protein HHL28_07625 [Aerophototrophica crusticola]|uniref:YbjN domain-containing protein n=1 Tax=Aerophototrophica crusticola TaxID=1709002 RepID=A0A858R703_9PROT|nr:hypothetical protein HHL28_07625 [Rhodospirillaceae bacterium B3]
MAQALEMVAKLAREVEKGLPLGPGAVRVEEDGDVIVLRPAPPSRHHFYLDGLLFHVAITPKPDGTTLFQIWAEVGYMPYTIESPEKRAKLQAILRSASWINGARFVVDEQQKILVLGQHEHPGSFTVNDLMWETVQFLQHARPYLRVLGQYL